MRGAIPPLPQQCSRRSAYLSTGTTSPLPLPKTRLLVSIKTRELEVVEQTQRVVQRQAFGLFLLSFIPLSLRTEHRASTVPRHPRLLFQFLDPLDIW
jgi:hypothetical protein